MTPAQVPQIQPPQVDPQTAAIKKIFDIGVGRYDVTVVVGPSYQSKRQEAVASMMDFMHAVPTAAPFIADLVARNSDWNGAKEIAERLEKMLPAPLRDDGDPAGQIQQLQQQHAQMTQELQLLTQHLQQAQQTIATKQQEMDLKLALGKAQEETKVTLARMDADVKLAVAEISTKAQIARDRMKLTQDAYAMIHGDAHEAEMQAQGHAQDMEAADQQHQQTLEQGEQANQNAQEQQEQVGQQQSAQQTQQQQAAAQAAQSSQSQDQE